MADYVSWLKNIFTHLLSINQSWSICLKFWRVLTGFLSCVLTHADNECCFCFFVNSVVAAFCSVLLGSNEFCWLKVPLRLLAVCANSTVHIISPVSGDVISTALLPVKETIKDVAYTPELGLFVRKGICPNALPHIPVYSHNTV